MSRMPMSCGLFPDLTNHRLGRHRQRETRPASSSRWRWLAVLASLGIALMACGGLPAAGSRVTPEPTKGDTLTVETSHWTVELPYCQFVEGGYQVTASACISAYSGDEGRVQVDVRVAQAEQDALVGLVLRNGRGDNYYVFGLTLDGDTFDGDWEFAKVVNGEGAVIATGSDPAIQRASGRVNTLRAEFAGKRFTFWVNGAQIGKAEEATFSGLGELGLNAGGNSSAVFTNLTYSCWSICVSPRASSPARPQGWGQVMPPFD
jgi:hypothetical protein